MKMKTGDKFDKYDVVVVCEMELFGLALVRKEDEWGVIGYCTGIKKNNISFFYKGMTENEAKMDFLERSPLFLSKYDIYDDVRNELLKKEAEDQISVYMYGINDISYEEAKKVQKMFDVDKLVDMYKQYNKSDDWKFCIERYVKENNINVKKDENENRG